MKENDIPAFPNTQTYQDSPGNERVYRGMTIRDYFASNACIGVLHGIARCESPEKMKDIAFIAYSIADAMIRERTK